MTFGDSPSPLGARQDPPLLLKQEQTKPLEMRVCPVTLSNLNGTQERFVLQDRCEVEEKPAEALLGYRANTTGRQLYLLNRQAFELQQEAREDGE